jgi:uncharacterized MnhB-related membrane protein
MNILRNFEAVFVMALGVAASASFLAQPPDAPTVAAREAAIGTESKMAVVTITAKRMSVQEKRHSLEDERRLAKQGSTLASRI